MYLQSLAFYLASKNFNHPTNILHKNFLFKQKKYLKRNYNTKYNDPTFKILTFFKNHKEILNCLHCSNV